VTQMGLLFRSSGEKTAGWVLFGWTAVEEEWQSSRQHGTAEVLVRAVCCPLLYPGICLRAGWWHGREDRLFAADSRQAVGTMLPAAFQPACEGLHMQMPPKKGSTA